eukprot:jgi/Ulvmu1/9641/UM054_0073.1
MALCLTLLLGVLHACTPAHAFHQKRGFFGLLQQYYDPQDSPARAYNGEEAWRNYSDPVTLMPLPGTEVTRNASFEAAHERITAQLLREAVPGELDLTAWDLLPNTPPYDPVRWHRVRAASPYRADWPNSMAICAFMKGEDPEDVMEWLAYYRWIGVDKVFLRENGDDVHPDLLEDAAGMIAAGFLDIGTIPGPKHPLQNHWYNRCAKPDFAGLFSWTAFVDLDEYIMVLHRGVAAAHPNIKDALRPFRGSAALAMQWVLFGTGGVVKRPPGGGMLRHFTRCSAELSKWTKCLVSNHHAPRRQLLIGDKTIHPCSVTHGTLDASYVPRTVLSNGARLHASPDTHLYNPKHYKSWGSSYAYLGVLRPENGSPDITMGHELVLFHYFTRSFEDYVQRKITRIAGRQTVDYRTYCEDARLHPEDPAAIAGYEKQEGFDRSAPICESAMHAGYARRIFEERPEWAVDGRWPKGATYLARLEALQLRQALEEREDVGLYDALGLDGRII